MLTEAINNFVEPLSKATGNILSRLKVGPKDRLKIGIHDNKFALYLYSEGAVDGYPTATYQARELFYRILEKEDRGYSTECRCAATDTTVVIIFHSFPMEQVVFESKEVEDFFYLLLSRFMMQYDRAKECAVFKDQRILGPLPEFYREHPELPLSDYQKAAVKFALGAPTSALFLDTGLGKTACAIKCIDIRAERYYKQTGKMYKVLVAAPAAVLLNWREEIRRFTTLQGKVTICRGDKFKRVRQFAVAIAPEPDCVFSVLVASYDTIAVCAKTLALVDWDFAVFDESQNVKDSNTNRFRAIKLLREKITEKLILSATPIGNSPMDLWAQMELLGEGLSGFAVFGNFRRLYGIWEPVYGAQGVEKLVALKNMPLLQERLARLSFTMTKAEAGIELPPKVNDIYEVEMTPKQAKMYAKMRDELAVEFEDALSGQVDSMQANHILTAMLRLAQITSGFATLTEIENDDGVIIRPKTIIQIEPEDNPKIKAVIEMLTDPEKDPLSKTIVWALFREDIRAISAALTKHKIKHACYFGDTSQNERDQIVTDFNNDDSLTVLVANAQTAGEGLNLLGYNPAQPEKSKMYTGHNIFFSQNWSAIRRKQAEDRAHRRGTRCQVRNTDLVVPDTIDEEIRKRVHAKRELAESVTDLHETLMNILK